MQLAIDALELFVRSLPKGADFSIISFGSRFEALSYQNKESMPYNDETRDFAVHRVLEFGPDKGGTQILPALEYVQKKLCKKSSRK